MQNRIFVLRTERGLSLSALAKLVGTTKAQIQKLERGDRRLSLDWMQRIAGALNVKVSDLLPVEDVPAKRSVSEAAIVTLIRQLSDADRATLVRVAQALMQDASPLQTTRHTLQKAINGTPSGKPRASKGKSY